MTQSALNDDLGTARVAYDRIQIRNLPLNCISVLAPLEDAFNAYVRSNTKWNDCITNFYCDVDSIDPYLQTQWAIATSKIAKARAGVNKLQRQSQ